MLKQAGPMPVRLSRKQLKSDLKSPGDWTFVVLDGKRVVVVCCPICGQMAYADNHHVVMEDPIHLDPSLVCKRGCHFYIRKGELVYVGRLGRF